MKYNLFIEEYVEDYEEDEDTSVDYKNIGVYRDEATHILIYNMMINQNLEVGKRYEFTFGNHDEETTYIYRVMKACDDGTYLLCEQYYNDKLYAEHNKNLLGDGWRTCDAKDEFELDLSEWI